MEKQPPATTAGLTKGFGPVPLVTLLNPLIVNPLLIFHFSVVSFGT